MCTDLLPFPCASQDQEVVQYVQIEGFVDLVDLKVLWMDGIVEVYKNVTASVRDGVLHIHEYNTRHTLIAEWHFPTNNIRVYHPADQENGHGYHEKS